MKLYNHNKIEEKWQDVWAKTKLYETDEKRDKPKFYALDMFPYPSGEGLHVGHPKGYIATDVFARMKTLKGFRVLHPMGWDAFGLPAENYALKNKIHPKVAVEKNIRRFKKQLGTIGFSYDWEREINTTDPDYYKWTQWIFLQLFKKGLAYESNEPINWCPKCKTGLANEDLENGLCERCGSEIIRKPMRQWVLKITDYADRLLCDLDAVEQIKVPLIKLTHGDDAIKRDLPLEERQAVVCIIKHWSKDKYLCSRYKKNDCHGFIIGGIEKDENAETAGMREAKEESGYGNMRFVKTIGRIDSQFFHQVKKVNRFAHFTCVYLELLNGTHEEMAKQEKDLHETLWLTPEEMSSFLNSEDMKYLWDLFTGDKKQALAEPLLDWEEQIKEQQRNWIGRSEGTEVDFKIKDSDDVLQVFTTRVDTVFGCTYMVIAPEHKLIQSQKDKIQNWKEVEKYIIKSQKKTELERTDLQKQKTGVELKGIKAINPFNNEEIPIFVADYIIGGYGTGAIMAVPAHDERDHEFAKKYKLPVKEVIAPYWLDSEYPPDPKKKTEKREVVTIIVRNPKTKKLLCLKWKKAEWQSFPTGGIDDDDLEAAARREILEETGYKNLKFVTQIPGSTFVEFYRPHKGSNVYAHFYYLVFDLKNEEKSNVDQAEKDNHEPIWVSEAEILDFINVENQKFMWRRFKDKKLIHTNYGILTDSGEFSGLTSEEAIKKMTKWLKDKKLGGSKVNYKLRDWVFSRQRYWGEPIPIIKCEKCGNVAVPEKDLPVLLPEVKRYEPTGTGESPLAAIKNWVDTKCPKCGGPGKRETNTMPQWAGSCWYYLRYIDPKNNKTLIDKKKEKEWMPVDLYVGGIEHATRHLLYARFWHKFLYDINAVATEEPFKRLIHVGLIAGEDGRKMSKRWGNVINPDDMVSEFGADSMRLYEMFMGPFTQEVAWSTKGIKGTRRFLDKYWALANEIIKNQGPENPTDLIYSSQEIEETALSRIVQKTIKKVGEDIEEFRFNTAVSAMMECLNAMIEIKNKMPVKKSPMLWKNTLEQFTIILSPFAPHITEEIWENLGHHESIFAESWPNYDEKLIKEELITLVVQVNGKVRDTIAVEAGVSEKDAIKIAEESEKIKKYTAGKKIKKTIFVKDKLINIVV